MSYTEYKNSYTNGHLASPFLDPDDEYEFIDEDIEPEIDPLEEFEEDEYEDE